MVVADVPRSGRTSFAMWGMNGKIDGCAVTVRKVLCKLPCQVKPLVGCQFVRQGQNELPGNACILARFGKLCGVPQGRAVQSPFGV